MITKDKIGYLIPEFPSQTHNFFWRERQALQELGIDTSLISTRRPPNGVISTSWAEKAMEETTYLFPLSILEFFQAFVIIVAAGPKAWFRCMKIIIHAPDMPLLQKARLMALVLVAAKLIRLSKTQGWNHVHVHSCADAANISMFASILSDLNYSLTLHNSLYVYGPNQKQKWKHAQFGIAINNKVFEELNRSLSGYLPKTIEVAPMGVNCSKFKRKTSYSPYCAEGSLQIFSCGRLNPIKGHSDLITSVKLLQMQGINIKLKIAGEDEEGGAGYRKELENLIHDLNLNDSVFLLGALSEEHVQEALERAHIFVLASLDEGVPVAVMEAMAMDLPVVVTDVGGVTELVNDCIDGIVVPPANPDAVADAILQILQNQDFARRLSHAARDKVITSFTHYRSAKVIANLLNQSTWTGEL